MVKVGVFRISSDSYEMEWAIEDSDVGTVIHDSMTEAQVLTILEDWFGTFGSLKVEKDGA